MKKVYTAGMRHFHTCDKCENDILPGQVYKRTWGKKYHLLPDCEHAQAVTATELPRVPDESEVRFHNPSHNKTRLLRCYGGIARVDHDCYACSTSHYVNQQMVSEILAGDEYNAEVWLIRGRLEVRFFHISCPFDPYEDYMRLKEEEDRQHEEEGWDDQAWPLAA